MKNTICHCKKAPNEALDVLPCGDERNLDRESVFRKGAQITFLPERGESTATA